MLSLSPRSLPGDRKFWRDPTTSIMKRSLFFLATTVLLSSIVQGQSPPRYHFDNIDIGVRLEPHDAKPLAKKLSKPSLHTSDAGGLRLIHVRPTGGPKDVKYWLRGFTTGNAQIDALLVEAGLRYGDDPMLLYALMHQESAFRIRAVSPKGALGVMQLMPGTAARFGVLNPFDPRQNIEGGTRYLRFLLDLFGEDIALALAGYNAGEAAVIRYGKQIPPYRETREYVRRIARRYVLLRDPEAVHRAKRADQAQLAVIEKEEPKPTAIYERDVFVVRLPDGKLRLVSQ